MNQNLNLKLSILQTDLSRAQYLLRSLIRQRLTKIEKFAMFYLLSSSSSSSSQPQSQSQQDQQPEDSLPIPAQLPEGPPPTCPLSRAEVNFLYSHQKLLARHFASSFLSSFPAQLRRLDDNAGGTSMVQGPDGKEVVFVRCLVGVVRGVVPGDGEEEGGGEEDGVVMRMGEVWVVRWESVRRAWERGEVEVL